MVRVGNRLKARSLFRQLSAGYIRPALLPLFFDHFLRILFQYFAALGFDEEAFAVPHFVAAITCVVDFRHQKQALRAVLPTHDMEIVFVRLAGMFFRKLPSHDFWSLELLQSVADYRVGDELYADGVGTHLDIKGPRIRRPLDRGIDRVIHKPEFPYDDAPGFNLQLEIFAQLNTPALVGRPDGNLMLVVLSQELLW